MGIYSICIHDIHVYSKDDIHRRLFCFVELKVVVFIVLIVLNLDPSDMADGQPICRVWSAAKCQVCRLMHVS